MLKRILSLILVLAMLTGFMLPVHTHAQETENTEAPVAEETIDATGGLTEETECPADPTAAATEETTEPTQPPVPEETVAPTEGTEEALQSFEYVYTSENDFDRDELYEAYAASLFYENSFTFFGSAAGENLTGDEKLLYDALVSQFKLIACGQRASTAITVGQPAADSSVDVEVTFEGAGFTSEQLSRVIDALLADLAFELYWYEKTTGCSASGLVGSKLVQITLKFAVADNYSAGTDFTVDTAKAGVAAKAAANAQDIVDAYVSASDYEKLIGYRDEICDLVDYNYAAANGNVFNTNIDPWQLIYVFDGDPETKVVCEGYSKAFQYLCDLTVFWGDVASYMVTGRLNSGAHMWNIVTIEGSNYLADVTNSDAGTAGYNGSLFLAGAVGSVSAGYTVSGIRYAYYDDTKELWGTGTDSILYLSSENYTPSTGGESDENIVAEGMCGTDLAWKLDDAGNLTISGTGEMTSAEWRDAAYQDQIKSVVIEDGVTSIAASAFRGCGNLTRVMIAESVTSIGRLAFSGCGALTVVNIPAGVTTLEQETFSSCVSLMNIVIPDTVTSIGLGAFFRCDGLERVKLSKSLESIGNSAFYECKSLTNIELPASVKTIDDWAFLGCSALESIEIPAGVTAIGEQVFYQCTGLKNVTIPDGVKSIGTRAFCGCTGLTRVELPDGVEQIGYAAFSGCSGLEEINLPDSVQRIDDWAFWYCTSLKEISIPEGVTAIGERTFMECTSLTEVRIPDAVKSIGNYAFSDCYALERVTFGSGVTGIGDNAFQFCTGLTSLDIPDNVSSIGQNAFNSCQNLIRVSIGEGVTTIGDNAFEYCFNMESVVLGAGVTSLGNYVFKSCPGIRTIVLPAELRTFGTDVFLIEGDAYLRAEDVYYGGTAEQWAALAGATPAADFVHYTCTEPENHWCATTVDMTCGQDGYTCDSCACGYERNRVIMEYAPGHKEIIDKAVAPTCITTGLTEGKHCGRCGDVYVEQEVIPVTNHNYEAQNGKCVCDGCGKEVYLQILHESVQLDLSFFTAMQLEWDASDDLRENIRWSIDGDPGILEIDQTGFVTAVGAGTVYAMATVELDGFAFSSRCRVDVTEKLRPKSIQLSTDKVTTELYKNEFATFEILLDLPQNHPVAEGEMIISDVATMALAGGSDIIESVEFANISDLFQLVMLDDRTVQVIPTQKALDEAKTVKSSYKDTVIVTIQGEPVPGTENLTVMLTVKKTLPKLKATVAAFNSFYNGQNREIVITGGTATSIYENESKATAIPNWLTLNEDKTLTLKADAPLKSVSGSAHIMVETEQWRIPTALTVSVKNTYKAPGLKLSATTVTASTRPDSSGVAMKLLCTNKKDTLIGLNVTDITAPEGYEIENFNHEDGSFTLKATDVFEAGKITLQVHFSDTENPLNLNLTIKTAAVTLKLAKTSVTLNKKASDSTEVKLTATPADFRITQPTIRLTAVENKVTVDKTDSGELDIRYENGNLHICTTDLTPEKQSYKLYVSAGGSREVVMTVNVISAEPTVTLKATGSMDLSFPEQTATITATFKNYSGKIAAFDYEVTEMKGKSVVSDNRKAAFFVEPNGKTFKIRCVDDSDIDVKNTFVVKLKLTLEDGRELTPTISLKLKRTIVKLKLSATKLTLNKLIGDEGSVTVSCATKGYAFVQPIWQLMDSKNVDAVGELDIRYEGGKLYVGTNDATQYGKTYKIILKADSYGTTYTLTVMIPTKAKSTPTATIKAAGKIDMIRDGSSVTITPTYKNCITTTRAEETITLFNSKKEDVTAQFRIDPNGKGGYTVTKAEGAKLVAGTYKVKLVSMFGETKVESKEISMSVVMGSTKLTVKSSSTTMFAKDRNDRALVWFEMTDTTLNEVSSITFKNANHAKMFEIIPYGDGMFAIGFKDGKVDKSLIATGKATGKTVTVSLNVIVDGNATTDPTISKTPKVNTTVNVKLTIMK